MNNTLILVVIILFMITTSVVVGELGLSSVDLVSPTMPENPEQGLFGNLFGLVKWAFDVGLIMFELMTFQVPGIPGLINVIIVTPMAFGLLYIGASLVRGFTG